MRSRLAIAVLAAMGCLLTGTATSSSAGHGLLSYEEPSWSPTGERIAFTGLSASGHAIYVIDADGRDERRLTVSSLNTGCPAWSPDGREIAFLSDRAGGGQQIYVMNADGSDQRQVTRGKATVGCPTWAPDGRSLLFAGPNGTAYAIYRSSDDGSGQRVFYSTRSSVPEVPVWSPKGAMVAFISLPAVTLSRWLSPLSLYVMRADGSHRRKLVAGITDVVPAWSPAVAQSRTQQAPPSVPKRSTSWTSTLTVDIVSRAHPRSAATQPGRPTKRRSPTSATVPAVSRSIR